MEKMYLVPHHLLNLAHLEQSHKGNVNDAVEGIITTIYRHKVRYKDDIFGNPPKVELYRNNVTTRLRRYQQRPDNTQTVIARLKMDDFCLSCVGEHIHCIDPVPVFTTLPKNHDLANRLRALEIEENNLYVEAFYRLVTEQPDLDPQQVTNIAHWKNLAVATTQLGVVRNVVRNVPLSHWEKVIQPIIEKSEALWAEINAYNSARATETKPTSSFSLRRANA